MEEKEFMLQVLGMRIDIQDPSCKDCQGRVFSEDESVDILLKSY